MDVVVVSNCAVLMAREVPAALAYGSLNVNSGQGFNYVKRVDMKRQ